MNEHGQDVPQVEKKADQLNYTDHSCVEILSLHTPVKVTYHLRVNESTLSGCTASKKEIRPFLISHRFFSFVEC